MMETWEEFLLQEKKRIFRKYPQIALQSPWNHCFQRELKSIWTLNKYYANSKPKNFLRKIEGWDDLATYWYSRLHSDTQRYFAKNKSSSSEDQWDHILRKQFTNITGWYRRQKLDIKTSKHKYSVKDTKWRKLFNYWSRALGSYEKRNSSWDKFLLSVSTGLASREKTKIDPREIIKIVPDWQAGLKLSRTRLFIQESRQGQSWNCRLNNSQSYLALMERKWRNYGKETG